MASQTQPNDDRNAQDRFWHSSTYTDSAVSTPRGTFIILFLRHAEILVRTQLSVNWVCILLWLSHGRRNSLALPAAAGPKQTNKQTRIFVFTLYQVSWTWNEQKHKYKKCIYNVVNWFSGKLVNLMPPDARFKAKMHQVWFPLGELTTLP